MIYANYKDTNVYAALQVTDSRPHCPSDPDNNEYINEPCKSKNLQRKGGCDNGCCDDFECSDCGYSFRIEWPD